MANDLDELKQEVEALREITQDTNRQVHKLRRAAWWGRLWSIVWWLTVAGVTGAAYYYYVQPYVADLTSAYGNAKDFQVQIQDWFAQFGHTNQ